jgi:hypothetical protein
LIVLAPLVRNRWVRSALVLDSSVAIQRCDVPDRVTKLVDGFQRSDVADTKLSRRLFLPSGFANQRVAQRFELREVG